MQEDFLRELGYLALATRLKRLGDRMIHSGRDLYKALGLEIEPNWYMIFKLLQAHKTLSVTDISGRLQLSHPSVISIIDKMAKKGLLRSERCPEDGRKQLVSLSDKALNDLSKYEEVWQAGIQGLSEMMSGEEPLPMIDKLEDAVARRSFKERTLDQLKTVQK